MSDPDDPSPRGEEQHGHFVEGIRYIDVGTGDPLVLVHGVGMNKQVWEPQIRAFAPHCRVIVPDLPGHGGSAHLSPDATLSDYVKALARFLDALDVVGATLVGHSMGALISIGLALERRQRIARLVALNAVYMRSRAERAAVQARAEEIAANGPESGMEEALSRWFGKSPGSRDREIAERVRGWLTMVSWQGYATAYRVFATEDDAFAGRLGEIGVPVLFATGELDPNSSPAMSMQMARLVPNGQARILPGARHMMNLTVPEQVNRMIEGFVASESAGAMDVPGLQT